MIPSKTIQYFFYFIFALISFLSLQLIHPFFTAIFLAFITVAMTVSIYQNIFETVVSRIYKVRNSSVGKWVGRTLQILIKLYHFILKWIGKLPVIRLFIGHFQEQLSFNTSEKKSIDRIKAFAEIIGIVTTVTIIFITFVLAVGLLFLPTIQEIHQLSKTYFDEASLKTLLHKIEEFINIFITFDLDAESITTKIKENIKPILNFLTDQLITLTGNASQWFTNGILYFLFLTVLYPNYNKFVNYLKQLSPLPDDQDEKFLTRILDMVKATVIGTWMVAFLQGVSTCFVFWLVDSPYPFFWGFLAFLLSVIPAVGPVVITVPFAIFYYATGLVNAGHLMIFVTVLNFAVDVFIRPVFTPKEVRLNAALFALGVFGGITAFGIIGLLYGPIIIIVLLTSLDLYSEFYQNRSEMTDD